MKENQYMKKTVRTLALLFMVLIGVNASTHTFLHKCSLPSFSFAASHDSGKKVLLPMLDSISLNNIDSSNRMKYYTLLKQKMQQKRIYYYQQYQQATTALRKKEIVTKAGIFLKDALVQNSFPLWYGTVWDYNGITETPGNGYIACGYFVSTTLKHSGVNMNRYKVAQLYSHGIVNTLCTEIKTYNNFENMMKAIEADKDELYIVGLDNHVGFIDHRGETTSFIHSSFVSPGYVTSEEARASLVLPYSNIYVVGKLSSNEKLIVQWMNGSFVNLVP